MGKISTKVDELGEDFVGKIGQEILQQIPQLAASTGSACHAGIVELSSVQRAMMINENVGKGTIRFSLGVYTTKEEIDYSLRLLKETIREKSS